MNLLRRYLFINSPSTDLGDPDRVMVVIEVGCPRNDYSNKLVCWSLRLAAIALQESSFGE